MSTRAVRHLESSVGRGAGGFTLVEAAVAMVIVSTMIYISLSAVTGSRNTLRSIADRAKATALAEDMISEILSQHYYDPVGGGGALGPATGQSRTAYNDVDDYHNATYTPPKYPNGTAIAGYPSDWTVTVSTPWIDPYNTAATRSSETGVKRITVTVKRGNEVLATLHAVRTVGWPGAGGTQYLP